MKRILEAGIIQNIQFDSKKEMYIYIGKLRHNKINHRCISNTEQSDGKVILTIIKAYNAAPLFNYCGTEQEERNG